MLLHRLQQKEVRMAEEKGVALVILGIVAVVAVIGLVLMFTQGGSSHDRFIRVAIGECAPRALGQFQQPAPVFTEDELKRRLALGQDCIRY